MAGAMLLSLIQSRVPARPAIRVIWHRPGRGTGRRSEGMADADADADTNINSELQRQRWTEAFDIRFEAVRVARGCHIRHRPVIGSVAFGQDELGCPLDTTATAPAADTDAEQTQSRRRAGAEQAQSRRRRRRSNCASKTSIYSNSPPSAFPRVAVVLQSVA